MKRIVILATAILALAACSKEMGQIGAADNGTLQTISVNVAPFNNVDTKTSINISTEGGKEAAVYSWTAGDQIGIYPVASTLGAEQTSQQIVFKINGDGGSSSATFTGTGWGLVTNGSYKYFSYYPYSATAKYNEAAVSYTDNLNQTENASTAHLGCNDYLYAPQIQPASAASAAFTFKHLSALVEFEITVPTEVKTKAFTRMEVTAPDAIFTTSGKYDPSSATASAAPAIIENAYTDILKLKFNNYDGFTPDANGKIHAYFLIAPAAVTSQTINVKLWDEDNKAYIASKTPTKDIAAGDYKIYECTATAKPTAVAEDLSANGTANCYIVQEFGKYKILANVRGNGVDPVSDDSEGPSIDMAGCVAEVIWETVNTNVAPAKGTIVNNETITIDGNYIVFSATGAQGNALIALKNNSNQIVWSWHIWSTDADLEGLKKIYPNNAGVMMDRNLGALSAQPGNGLTVGFHYQWGRPFPITGGSSDSEGAFCSTRMATTNSSIWVEEETTSSKGTLAYSAANPTHFIYTSASNYLSGTTTLSGNWLWTANDYPTAASVPIFWGSSKTMYDPCPIGWKVPAGGNTGVWSTAGFSNETFILSETEKGRLFNSPVTYYPNTGYFDSVGSLYNFGAMGGCWSATSYSLNSYMMYFYKSGVSSYSLAFNRAFGLSVRPVHE